VKRIPRAKAPRPVVAAAESTVHPADGPRHATGSKSDAWVMALPGLQPPPGAVVVAFGTGRDSATIVIGGVEGAAVRRHPGHDVALVVPEGSGVLRHGPSPDAPAEVPFSGPCTVIVPAGTWHAIVPDEGSPLGVAFLTRPGTTIDPFSVVGPRAEPGIVHLDTLPVSPWPMAPAEVVSAAVPTVPAGRRAPSPLEPSRPARVDRYAPPVGSDYTLPVDTGTDTLFVMSSVGRSWDRSPVDVAVHRHDREDEYIVLAEGAEGWLLNGPTQESVERVPFRGPCVLVMPSGNFHRVVRTDDTVVRSILIYAHRSQTTGTWAEIQAEMELWEIAG
jgi:uncharacterized protein YjlB